MKRRLKMANSDMRRRLAMMFEGSPVVITGEPPITTSKRKLLSLKAFGDTEQNGTPTSDVPVDIVSNNGVLKVSRNSFDGTIKQGGLGDTGGVETPLTTRIRSTFVSVKPNTTYNISWVTNSEIPIDIRRIHFYDANNTWMSAISGTTFTTPADTAFIRVAWEHTDPTVTITPSDISNVQLELGSTATPYTPYSSTGVYADGTVETINVHGKNLFDLNTMNTGHGWWVNGNVVNDTPSANMTIVIDCKPNTAYSFWHTEGTGGCRAFALNKDTIAFGDAASWLTLGSTIYKEKNVVTTVTTPTDAKKLYILAGRRDTVVTRAFEDQLTDFMVVEGEVEIATPYEPYYDGGTATTEMMLKVGDYQDVQSILDGVVTRNVGVKVFDGTENFVMAGSDNKLRCYILDDIGLPTTDGLTSPMICSHYTFGGYLLRGGNTTPGTFNGYSGGNNFAIRFSIVNMGITTVDDFKQWLANQYAAGTPVIILYPLATPTTEQVTGRSMTFIKGTNIVDITQASLDNLELEIKAR